MENEFIQNEHEVLKFWNENACFEKLRVKNKNGKPFRYLDGPITANNAMGIHHAWGRSIKDIFLRYKAMNGFSCHYRNGFDSQGLWVEVEVEKELSIKDKKDIETYGIDNFTNKCVDRVKKYSDTITEQSKRLGQWMDWDNSYFTNTEENITSIWHFLKVCNDKGWIAQSHKPMPWCPRCGTSLSEHEMTGSHKLITHMSVFAKLPIKEKEYDILVWTTTPWTLAANVALAVNSELDYAVVELPNSKRPLVIAKNALSVIEGERKVLSFIKGAELVGLSYETFLPLLPVQKHLTHRIVSWEDVTADEGSGVVHIAPGCGAGDFELGKQNGLAEICPIGEDGHFSVEYDFLAGKSSSEAAQLIFNALEDQGKLYKTHEYTHSYPVCWRCKTEVLFRLVSSWVIKTDEIRPQLLKAASEVKWSPAYTGKRMQDWLTNMDDWNISRKRYYGLPLPFYHCKNCGHLTVIGSKEELRELGGSKVDELPELHRPFIDDITITCPDCGKVVSRIPEVGDVWLDAGITPFSTLGYFSDRKQWERWFPAEWVIEMNEQIRLWFYSLLFMSVTLTGRAPYEQVMTHASVVQEDGSKFHKSGYMIRFDEAAEKIGSDTIRYLYAGANTSSDVRFGYHLGDEARRKLLGLHNIYTFFMTYAEIDSPQCHNVKSNNIFDKWLINRINLFVSKSINSYENYNTAELIREFENCVDDVSNWYVRLNRRRFWKKELDTDKQEAYNSLFFAIKTMCKIMAPIIPFMAEHIWQTMVRRFSTAELSVHLSEFPKQQVVNSELLKEVETVREIIAGGMKLRNETQIKVRQPLPILYLENTLEPLCKKYKNAIMDELNIKEMIFLTNFDVLCEEKISLDFKNAGRVLKSDLNTVKQHLEQLSELEMSEHINEIKRNGKISVLGHNLSSDLLNIAKVEKKGIKQLTGNINLALCITITPKLKAEGAYRDILRHCQVLRKEAGFDVDDRVKLSFTSNSMFLTDVITKYKESIENETLATVCEIMKPIQVKQIEVEGEKVTVSISTN